MAIPLLAYYAICALLASTILHVSLTLIEYGVPFFLPSLDTIHIARLSYPFRRLIGQDCQNIPAKQDMSPLELVLTLVLVAYLGPVMNRVIWALASFTFSVVSRPIHTILVISFALFRAFRSLARSTARHRRFLIPLFLGGLVTMAKSRLSDERQPLVSPSLFSLVVLALVSLLPVVTVFRYQHAALQAARVVVAVLDAPPPPPAPRIHMFHLLLLRCPKITWAVLTKVLHWVLCLLRHLSFAVVYLLRALLAVVVSVARKTLYAFTHHGISSISAGIGCLYQYTTHISLGFIWLLWVALLPSLLANHWAVLWEVAIIVLWSVFQCVRFGFRSFPNEPRQVLPPPNLAGQARTSDVADTAHIVPLQPAPHSSPGSSDSATTPSSPDSLPTSRPFRPRPRSWTQTSSSDDVWVPVQTHDEGKSRQVDDMESPVPDSPHTPPRNKLSPIIGLHTLHPSAYASPSPPQFVPNPGFIKETRRAALAKDAARRTSGVIYKSKSLTFHEGEGGGAAGGSRTRSNSFQLRAPFSPDESRHSVRRAGRAEWKGGRNGERTGLVMACASVALVFDDDLDL